MTSNHFCKIYDCITIGYSCGFVFSSDIYQYGTVTSGCYICQHILTVNHVVNNNLNPVLTQFNNEESVVVASEVIITARIGCGYGICVRNEIAQFQSSCGSYVVDIHIIIEDDVIFGIHYCN